MADGVNFPINFQVLKRELLAELSAQIAQVRAEHAALRNETRAGLISSAGATKSIKEVQKLIAASKQLLQAQRSTTQQLTQQLQAHRALFQAQQQGVVQSNRLAAAGGGAGNTILRNINAASGGFRRFNTIANTVSRTLISVGSLTAVFAAIEGLRQGVLFGDEFERAEVQIAGIIASTGRLIDTQGNLLKPAQAFGAALGDARDQTKKLQVDALTTTATFRELLQAFQVSIGPGLAANLGLDQIRELTVGISQAATAVGLPLNQLAEEIRSLFGGTIDKRNTRLATILGIDNEDIKNAREAGRLFEFLQERLSGITTAAQSLNTTLGQSLSNALDALAIVGARVLDPFRDSLIGLTTLLKEGLSAGVATEALTGIGRALAAVTDGFVNFFANLDPGKVEAFFSVVEDLAGILASSLVPVLGVVADALGIVATVIGPFVSALRSIVDTDFGQAILRGAAAFIVFRAALNALTGAALRSVLALHAVEVSLVTTAGSAAAAGVAIRGLLAVLGPIGIAAAVLSTAFALFGGSAGKAAKGAKEELEKLRAEGERLATEGQIVPLIEGFEAFEKAVTDASDRVKKLRDEIETLGRQKGLSRAVADLVKAVSSTELSFDFEAADRQIAELTGRMEVLKQRQITGLVAGPRSPGGFPGPPVSVRQDEETLARTILDLEKQRLDILEKRRRAAIQIAGLEARRLRENIEADLPDLQDRLLIERAVAEAAASTNKEDNDRLDVLKKQVELRALERTFLNDFAVLSSQGFEALIEGQGAALAEIELSIAALEQEYELRRRILELQLQSAETEAETAARHRKIDLLDRTKEAIEASRESRSRLASAESRRRTADFDPETSTGQLQRVLERQDDVRRQIQEESELRADLAENKPEEFQEKINSSLERTLDLETELLGLERDRRDIQKSTQFGAGFNAGVEGFRQANQPGQIGNRLAGDVLGASTTLLSESLFTVVANAFDPNSNQSLGDAIKGLVTGFGASILKAVTDALAAQAVAFLLGPATAAASGGKIPGYAGGGGVMGGPNLAYAPSGAASSDRTLAAMTPGEFVINRTRSQQLGYGWLDRLNTDRLTETDFRRMSPRLSRGVQSLAGGGEVTGRAGAPGVQGRSAGGLRVLPVLVSDRENVRALLRGRGFDESLSSRATLLRSAVSPRE